MTTFTRPSGRSLAAVVGELARRQPGHPAILYEGQTITYAELHEQATAVARSLVAIGVGHGHRVGALLANQPEWIVMALAAARVGATYVPFNTWYKRHELAWTLRHCGVSCFVTLPRFLKQDYAQMLGELIAESSHRGQGRIACADFPGLRTLVTLGAPMAGAMRWDEFLALGDTVAAQRLAESDAVAAGSDIAYILYTSGSTAEPKGVTLAHGGVVDNGWDMGVRRWIDRDDRVWLGSPLFYGLGATNALPVTLTRGATIVLQGAFEAGKAIEVIERTQATVYYGTGNMTRALLDHPTYRRARLGSLQKGNAGTMPEFKRLSVVEIGMSLACSAYGLTESYGNATVGEPDEPVDVKLRTNGRPLPGTEVLIVDPVSGGALRSGETGLVMLRGHTTPGYFENAAANAQALRADGWFDTGDLGSLDAQGRFVFHARLKEIIKTGGINVSPMEIEGLLLQHPHIRDAHVVGVADTVRGEIIVAFVDADRTLGEGEVRDFVRERAASFKVPHHVLFRSTAQLPRVASGKIARHRLVEEARTELGIP